MEILSDALRAAISTETAVFCLVAIALNIQYGYAGLLNFGQVGYLLLGGYGVAVVVTFGGGFWLGVVAALALSVVLSLLVGLPTLRLRADYFAIASLAIAESIRLLVRSRWLEPVTGGVEGLSRFADGFFVLNPIAAGAYALGPLHFTADQLFVLAVAWVCALLALGLVWLLVHSPWGRVLRAIREDEDAVRSLGKPVFLFKMQSLLIGGLLTSVAGVLLATNQQTVSPEAYLPAVTFYAYTALILGGAGRVFGPLRGAILFWVLLAVTESTVSRLSGGFVAGALTPQQLATVRFVLVGLALMWLLTYRPEGLFVRRSRP